MRVKPAVFVCFLLPIFASLTGCSTSFTAVMSGDVSNPEIVSGDAFQGVAMGGQQPIASSHLYLFAADTTGYGHASDSLIQADPSAAYPSHEDANGNYYIVTAPNSGSFYFTSGQYQCAAGQEVYLYLSGGNAGLGSNSAISEIAVLGTCNSSGLFSQLTGNFVYMNEISTVAASYALAGFATDSTHVASSSTALGKAGLTNAFNAAANLYNINAGASAVALATTPQGGGIVPQAEINALADMLAACINSSSLSSINCSTLLSNATNASGTAATDAASAMMNIAHNPAHNVANLFSLFSNVSPFQPTLSIQPTDFSVILTYATGTGAGPADMAIDASGDVWVTNNLTATVTEIANNGKLLSGAGYTNSDMLSPTGIAIDQSGDAWIADESDSLIKIAAGGASSESYTGADLTGDPQGIAIDGNGMIWITQDSNQAVQFSPSGTENFATTGGALKNQNGPKSIAIDTSNNAFIINYKETALADSVSKFSSSGTADSSGSGYGYSLDQKNGLAIAVDGSGNFWITNSGSNSVTIGNNSGTSVAVATGALTAGLSAPQGIAFDGSGDAWITNNYGTVSVLSSTGAAVTGVTGYSGTTASTMSGITILAVDGSGNVWMCNKANGNIYEFVGAATPIVTPRVAGLSSPYTPTSRP
jgi:streptogramin lyase